MDRRTFLGAMLGSAGLSAMGELPALLPSAGGAALTGKPPNIVFMLVDDLGWGDFACYGSSFHETPNIDRLASDGIKFTHAYAAAPVCSPSRAAILTGKYPARLGLTQWIPGVVYPHKKLLEASSATHLPRAVPTIASELKKLGYQTAAIGKWHLGEGQFLPEDFGFDVNIAGDQHGHPAPPNGYFGPFNYHNLQGYTEKDNLTEVLSDKVDRFLEAAAPRNSPFFLYFAEYAVHLPLQEREEHIRKYREKNGGHDEPDPVYAAMVESVDTALGRLRRKLSELGVAENTVIVLTSDNGGVGFQGQKLHLVGDNGPFRGGKGFLYEGGLREPLIVHWPGVTKAGSVSDTPVWGPDFLPTLLSIAGAKSASSGDGMDISAVFKGNQKLDRQTLYWHYPHYSDQGGSPSGVILEGDWKLIEYFEDGHLELFDLALDPGEKYDLSSSFDEKAIDLRTKLRAWRKQVHAVMPTENPAWLQTQTESHKGHLGCSADPAPGCLED